MSVWHDIIVKKKKKRPIVYKKKKIHSWIEFNHINYIIAIRVTIYLTRAHKKLH